MEERKYRYYIADCAAGLMMMLGAKNVTRLWDIDHPAPVDERSAAEIVADITARAGLKVVKKHERTGSDGDVGA